MLSDIKSYRDLMVWQKSIRLVKDVYQITRSFPKEELFSIVSQMKKSAVSIPSNIAEGYGRNSRSDYIRFLKIAVGSLYELQTQMEISKELHFISEKDLAQTLAIGVEIEKMLVVLIRKLEKH